MCVLPALPQSECPTQLTILATTARISTCCRTRRRRTFGRAATHATPTSLHGRSASSPRPTLLQTELSSSSAPASTPASMREPACSGMAATFRFVSHAQLCSSSVFLTYLLTGRLLRALSSRHRRLCRQARQGPRRLGARRRLRRPSTGERRHGIRRRAQRIAPEPQSGSDRGVVVGSKSHQGWSHGCLRFEPRAYC